MKRVIAATAAIIIGAAMIVFAPAAVASTLQPGCVFSGGGWICYGTQPPSDPGELPVVDPPPVVEVVEPAPEPPAPVVVDPPAVVTPPSPAPVVEAPAPPPSCG